jgi:hypothetical protein
MTYSSIPCHSQPTSLALLTEHGELILSPDVERHYSGRQIEVFDLFEPNLFHHAYK